MPDYIDTTDLLARALEDYVAFVPGRAAYVDGRGGSSMRLNFSGVGEDDIREGIRRIGEVVREQVAMYGTLTGVRPPRPEAARSAERVVERTGQQSAATAEGEPPAGADLAKILRLPDKRQRTG
jgi:2-aminoadipate transaminase